jgi:hypothetical protein
VTLIINLIIFEGTFAGTSFFKEKLKRRNKTAAIKVFLTVSDPYLVLMALDPAGGPKHTDPDPQQCLKV